MSQDAKTPKAPTKKECVETSFYAKAMATLLNTTNQHGRLIYGNEERMERQARILNTAEQCLPLLSSKNPEECKAKSAFFNAITQIQSKRASIQVPEKYPPLPSGPTPKPDYQPEASQAELHQIDQCLSLIPNG